MDGVTTVTDRGVPPDVTWWRTADGTAHAFAFRAGIRSRRSMCAREQWPGLGYRAATEPSIKQCRDCALLASGAPGEITESELRLLDGNR